MCLAVDFTTDKNAKNGFADDTVAVIVKRVYEKGGIASAIGTAFELAPAYTVSRSDVGLIVGIASEAIVEAARGRGLF
jgi:adenosylmethionine-8-amino-7-oxononanoate aminotransferase